MISKYQDNHITVLGEQPRVQGVWSPLDKCKKFSAYHVPMAEERIYGNCSVDNSINELSLEMSKILEEGLNFLRVEASEIIAFLATDCD